MKEEIILELTRNLVLDTHLLVASITNTTSGVCLTMKSGVSNKVPDPTIHVAFSPEDAIRVGRLLQRLGENWKILDYPNRPFP